MGTCPNIYGTTVKDRPLLCVVGVQITHPSGKWTRTVMPGRSSGGDQSRSTTTG